MSGYSNDFSDAMEHSGKTDAGYAASTDAPHRYESTGGIKVLIDQQALYKATVRDAAFHLAIDNGFDRDLQPA